MKNVTILISIILLTGCSLNKGVDRAFFTEETAISTDYTKPHQELAATASSVDDYVNAIKILQPLYQQRKEARVALQLAENYLKLGDLINAEFYYQQATKDNKTQVAAWVGMGKVALQHGNAHQAMNHFAQALKIDENDYKALNGMAVALDSLGKYQHARNYYRKLLTKNSNDKQVYNNLAVSYLLQGQYHEAEEILRQLIASRVYPKNALYNLAIVYSLSGQSQKLHELMQVIPDKVYFNRQLTKLKSSLR
ncbi:tetratricopeptide repeat protein [Endozoicomonas sp. SM1973]|uniref:Tetratricopeptide repeat protein n=1 Tax=Spartinivicinus marinus TaxID=2994442 RepID=A0A853IDZ6_9GAMM|nr:tetratricopeptide repeat protein [Spartinivicinus marinus]MCX4029082.1 tetratricopeptide repeat protein [Spartinivicinus marinus]NYZ68768.1 tetratricopeptide repeat protein [Spartinivicinus marinus]